MPRPAQAVKAILLKGLVHLQSSSLFKQHRSHRTFRHQVRCKLKYHPNKATHFSISMISSIGLDANLSHVINPPSVITYLRVKRSRNRKKLLIKSPKRRVREAKIFRKLNNCQTQKIKNLKSLILQKTKQMPRRQK